MEAKLFVPQKSCKIWQVSISGFFFFFWLAGMKTYPILSNAEFKFNVIGCGTLLPPWD